MSEEKRTLQILKLGHLSFIREAAIKLESLRYTGEFDKERSMAELLTFINEITELADNIKYSLTWLCEHYQ